MNDNLKVYSYNIQLIVEYPNNNLFTISLYSKISNHIFYNLINNINNSYLSVEMFYFINNDKYLFSK